jgi:hypothetical protein
MSEEERRRRMDRARSAIGAELAIGLMVTLLTGFLFIASPSCLCPAGLYETYEPSLLVRLFTAAPIVLPIVGLVWMVRLSQPRPEAGEPTWRYRAWRD